MVELIYSATKKFTVPQHYNHVNFLYINWTYSEFPSNSYLEACSLLFNDINGLLKKKDIGLNLGINEEAYDKITAIAVYTDSLNSMLFQDFRYLWSTGCFSLLPNSYLNQNLINNELLLQITDMKPKEINYNRFPRIVADIGAKDRNKILEIYEIISL